MIVPPILSLRFLLSSVLKRFERDPALSRVVEINALRGKCAPIWPDEENGPAFVRKGRVYHWNLRPCPGTRAQIDKLRGDDPGYCPLGQSPSNGCPSFGRDCHPSQNIPRSAPPARRPLQTAVSRGTKGNQCQASSLRRENCRGRGRDEKADARRSPPAAAFR